MKFFYTTVKTLIKSNRTTATSRAFVTTTSSSVITSPPLFTPLYKYNYHYPRPLTLSSKWIAPFHGPLFLSSPPWKLLQSSTPLYLRGNSVVLKKVEALSLSLLRRRIESGYVTEGGASLNGVCAVEEDDDGVRNEFLESFWNVPNLISLSRLASGPVLAWMITEEMYSAAFVGLAISGATDWLDGYMARKMRIDSVVGSYLDPLADKVLIGCVAFAMVKMDLLHPGLVGLVIFRDAGLVAGALYQRASSLGWKWRSWYDFVNIDGTSPHKVQPLYISKVNTVLQLILVAGALLQPEFGTIQTQSYITYLSWLVASTTIASTAAYGTMYMTKKSALITRKS